MDVFVFDLAWSCLRLRTFAALPFPNLVLHHQSGLKRKGTMAVTAAEGKKVCLLGVGVVVICC